MKQKLSFLSSSVIAALAESLLVLIKNHISIQFESWDQVLRPISLSSTTTLPQSPPTMHTGWVFYWVTGKRLKTKDNNIGCFKMKIKDKRWQNLITKTRIWPWNQPCEAISSLVSCKARLNFYVCSAKKAHLHYKQSSRETDELFICLPEMNDINYSFKGASHLHFTETVCGGLCCVNKVKFQHFTLSLIKAKVSPSKWQKRRNRYTNTNAYAN